MNNPRPSHQRKPSLPRLAIPGAEPLLRVGLRRDSDRDVSRSRTSRHDSLPPPIGYHARRGSYETGRKHVINPYFSTVTPYHNDLANFKDYIITVEIVSNYGHQSEICCSEIDILDMESRPIPVIEIQFVPQANHLTSPENLINGSLIKSDGQPEWSCEFNHPGQKILLKVQDRNPPASLRIWNSRSHGEKCIKEILISVGTAFVTKAEIPQKFGTIISLERINKFGEKITESPFFKLDEDDVSVADKYGEIGVRTVREIKLEIVETFAKQEFVGLNCIEFFTVGGRRLNLDNDISKIDVENLNVVSAPQRLIRSYCTTTAIGDMWVARRTNEETPYVSIVFKHPIALAAIKFWNATVQNYMEDFGVKKIIMHFDGKAAYSGRLKQSLPNTENLDKYTTVVWFTDIPHIRGKVKARF